MVKEWCVCGHSNELHVKKNVFDTLIGSKKNRKLLKKKGACGIMGCRCERPSSSTGSEKKEKKQ